MRGVGAGGTRRGRPGSGWDRWLGSWRVALRLGRREARRHPGRSALIMALVAAPVLLITAFLSFFTSQDISLAEGMDREMGEAVAVVRPVPGPVGIVAGVGQTVEPGEGRVAPGFAASDPWDAPRVSATVGSPVLRVGQLSAVPEGAGAPVPVLVLDGPPEGAAAPLASLRSGRWARSEDEVVVTRAGTAAGLPGSGRVSVLLGQDDDPTTLTVVGVADAVYSPDQEAALVLPAAAAPSATSWGWLVDRAEPVLLDEAQTWALHGLDVSSRHVLLNPPPDQDWRGENATKLALFYAMIGLAVLAETVLLAGPAFAVSAARQRRSLALAGAQGAARVDVRRVVVAYGLVLALAATVVAVTVGAALGLGGALVLSRLRPLQHVGLELPWVWVLPLAVAAVVAAGVAAWWPARGATRLDIMSVLRGQVVSVRVGRGWPLVGAGLAVAGLAALGGSLAVEPYRADLWLVGGAVLLGLGGMLLVPAVLALVARLSARAPLAVRLAARDSLRQRSRAVPAVLAIVAAVGVMSATATVQVSAAANQERQYTPQVPPGTIAVATDGSNDELAATVEQAVATTLPGATAYPTGVVESGPGFDLSGNPVDRPFRDVVPADCAPEEVTTRVDEAAGGLPHCYVEAGGTYAVVSPATLELTGGLNDGMREVLGAGGLIVWVERVAGADAVGRGEAMVVSAPATATGQEGRTELTGEVDLDPVPVYWATAEEMDRLRTSRQHSVGGYLTPQAADRLGWESGPGGVLVAADDPLGVDDAAALEEAVGGHGVTVYLERGWVPDPAERTVTLVMLAVFSLVALAAVVISTALTISEGQRDSATMAAIGAPRVTRRLVAAMHAVLVGAVGVLVGLALGLTVGAAMSWVSTSMNRYGTGYRAFTVDGGVVAVPWPALSAAALAVPLLAAVVAWVSVRRQPQLVRPVA